MTKVFCEFLYDLTLCATFVGLNYDLNRNDANARQVFEVINDYEFITRKDFKLEET